MHSLVKRLLVDIHVYEPVPSSTTYHCGGDIPTMMECGNQIEPDTMVPEQQYRNKSNTTRPTNKSVLVMKSSRMLSRGLVRVGIMPRTGTPALWKAIKQD